MSQPDHAARAAELAQTTEPFPELPADHPDKGAHLLYLGDAVNGEVSVGGRTYDLNPHVIALDSHEEALAVGHAAHPGRRGIPGWVHPDQPQLPLEG